jgi:coenzyme Q-binding protein COQ10
MRTAASRLTRASSSYSSSSYSLFFGGTTTTTTTTGGGDAARRRRSRTIFSAAKDAFFGSDSKKDDDENNASSKQRDDNNSMHRSFASRKIVRDVTPSQLFEIVADVNKYHEFLPFCRRSKVTNEIDKDRFEAELEIGFKVFNERYTSRVTLERPRKVTAEDKSNERDGGGALFEKMKTVWRFRELEEDEEDEDEDDSDEENEKEKKNATTRKRNVSTVVDFEIAFKVKSSAHAAALSVFFEDVANTQIQAFEKRCRSLMSLPNSSSSSSSSSSGGDSSSAN